MTTHSISAPGKVILSGEHAVVYGYPALVSAVNMRLTLSLKAKSSKKTTKPILKMPTAEYISAYLKQNYAVNIHSDIPRGSGLGSSAAYAVSLATAYLSLRGKPTKKHINDLAFQLEKSHHGNPSGVDNTACTYGGYLWFRKEHQQIHLMHQLPITKKIQCFLLQSGQPKETTKDMIAYVAEQRKMNPEKYKKIFDKIESITKTWLAYMFDEVSRHTLLEAVRENHRLLSALGVVSPKASALFAEIEKIGGSAKITGAGGKSDGSGMLLIFHDDKEKLTKFAQKKKLKMYPVQLGERG